MTIAEVYAQRARKKRFSVTSGPWTRVVDSSDPGEARLNTLYEATDVVFMDPARGAGVRRRPGCPVMGADVDGAGFSATPQLGTGGGTPNREAHAVYDHTDIDGTIRQFFIIGLKIYRLTYPGGIETLTNVTPGGITISPSGSARVYCVSLAGKLIVNDGVNRPWVGTNLGATPITGAYIDFDGAAGAWTARGAPTVFGGSVVFIANSLAGVSSKDTILWSAPADPTIGYKQSGYANFWELFQTSTESINAILGTNAEFYYWRDNSIGSIPGPTLNIAKAAATHDNVSTSVGCTAAATVVKAGDVIFFEDASGRPYRLPIGGAPEDLSWQLRRTILSTSVDPVNLSQNAWAAWVQDLNLVVFGIWGAPSTTVYLFAADTGAFNGTWTIQGGVTTSGRAIIALGGVLRDRKASTNRPVFYFLGGEGSASYAAATAGYIYRLFSTTGTPADTGYDTFGTSVPTPTATTHALAYDARLEKAFDGVTAEVSSGVPDIGFDHTWVLNYMTARAGMGSNLSALATSTYTGAYDGIARAVWAIEGRGRYLRARIVWPAVIAYGYQALHLVHVDGATNGSPPEGR